MTKPAEMDTPNPVAAPVTLPTAEGDKTFSPSPDPASPLPQRRTEDTKTYAGEWTVLLLALLGWASTFCLDMAQEESFANMMTPSFLGTHIGQLFSVMAAVTAAKRIR